MEHDLLAETIVEEALPRVGPDLSVGHGHY